jgi:hypothetical protein
MGFVFQGFTTFLPTYLAGQAGIEGLSSAQVRRRGSFASVALLFGGLGHLAAGRLMKSSRREIIFLASVLFNALCLGGVAIGGATLVAWFGLATGAWSAGWRD